MTKEEMSKIKASEVILATGVRTRVAQSRCRGEVQPQGRGLAKRLHQQENLDRVARTC